MTTDTISTRLRALRDKLSSGLVERDLTVRLALLAALAGEHLLLLGPPGTAKSLVARRLHLAFADASYFERLLTRFTVPEELFGPLSIKGLEEDRYERLTTAYLPTASIAFLDEIFKANSAILNALLTLLNEREFDNGAKRIRTPLVAVIGASNELPDGEELDALFDRFLLRLHVGPVTKEAFPALLALRGHATPEVPAALRLTEADLASLQKLADDVEVPDDVVAMLCDLRDCCGGDAPAHLDASAGPVRSRGTPRRRTASPRLVPGSVGPCRTKKTSSWPPFCGSRRPSARSLRTRSSPAWTARRRPALKSSGGPRSRVAPTKSSRGARIWKTRTSITSSSRLGSAPRRGEGPLPPRGERRAQRRG